MSARRSRTWSERMPPIRPHAAAQRIALSFSTGEVATMARLIARLMRSMPYDLRACLSLNLVATTDFPDDQNYNDIVHLLLP